LGSFLQKRTSLLAAVIKTSGGFRATLRDRKKTPPNRWPGKKVMSLPLWRKPVSSLENFDFLICRCVFKLQVTFCL